MTRAPANPKSVAHLHAVEHAVKAIGRQVSTRSIQVGYPGLKAPVQELHLLLKLLQLLLNRIKAVIKFRRVADNRCHERRHEERSTAQEPPCCLLLATYLSQERNQRPVNKHLRVNLLSLHGLHGQA